MPRIVMWTNSELSGLDKAWGLACILTEVNDDGAVTREIGFDAQANIIHRCPGEPTLTEYGVFDLAKVDPIGHSDIDQEEFERLWSA